MEKEQRNAFKKIYIMLIILFSLTLGFQTGLAPPNIKTFANDKRYIEKQVLNENLRPLQMAIVIDDFGYDRKGVDEMLDLNCTLTCAVMPCLEFSEADANKAHEKGHEVILHMPMEAYGNLPLSWYGPLFVANGDTKEVAYNKVNQALNSIPHVNGMNIHMGTALSHNKELMKEIMRCAKERNMVFLDSRTIEGSVCPEVAQELGVAFLERDIFLEVGGANYTTAMKRMAEAIEFCKANGRCIVIGHIGAVGQAETARAIKDNLQAIKDSGIEIVPLSALIK
jgi:polysaccharide deacetylase 2 family uncharacterized protein YibQ